MFKNKEIKYLTTLATTLVVLGIIFSSDRLIGYSFIGAGVLFSIIVIRARKRCEVRNKTGGGY